MDSIKKDYYANRPYLLSKHSFPWENKDYNALYLIQDFYDINEHQLYYGYIQTDEIEFENLDQVLPGIKLYIEKKLWTPFKTSPLDGTSLTDVAKKMIAKQVYLFNEYQTSRKKWKYPITVHYNPRQGTFVAHPGGTRTRILSLIGAEKTLVWYHTIDKNIKPKGELEAVSLKDVRSIHKARTDMVIDFVPDHGSFIPHIAYDMEMRPTYLIRSQQNIITNLSAARIHCNSTELQILNPLVSSFRKWNKRAWKLVVTNYSLKSELNCFFSLCNGKNYKDTNMSLKLCN